MRRQARTDSNQRSIVAALRKAGASVQSLHQIGGGCPDLLVGLGGRTVLLGVKDGDKPPSERMMTAEQRVWASGWRGGALWVVHSPDEAMRAVGLMVGRSLVGDDEC